MEKTASLYARINAVKAGIKRVPKTGKNTHFNYNYATESDISDLVRPLMAECGVCLVFKGPIRNMTEIIDCPTKSGGGQYFYRIWVKYILVNTDRPEEREEVLIPGEALDQQDKGFSKALTAAAKYAWLKIFDISTGDESADRDSDQPSDKEPRLAPSYTLPPSTSKPKAPRAAIPTSVPVTKTEDLGKKVGVDQAADLIAWLTSQGKGLSDLRSALYRGGYRNAIRGKEENVADWPHSLLGPIEKITLGLKAPAKEGV